MVPARLNERLRQRRVLPFVGAGVSMAVKNGDGARLFPSWNELLLAGADRLEREGKARYAELVRLLVEEDHDFLGAAGPTVSEAAQPDETAAADR